jgi:hypothetical protein
MEDQVSELNCDNRHMFHTLCLEMWLKTNPESICPLCKKPISTVQHQNQAPRAQAYLDNNPPELLQGNQEEQAV